MEIENKFKLINEKITSVRKRVFINELINNTILAMVATLLLSIILNILSRGILIYNPIRFLWVIATVLFLTSVIYTLYKLPKKNKIVRLIDSKGLKERITTALEIEKDNKFYEEVVTDAFENIKTFNTKKNFPIKANIKYSKILALLLGVFLILTIVPNPLSEKAKVAYELKEEKKKEKEKLQEAKKEVEENKQLSDEKKQQLIKKLEELKNDIDLAKDKKELSKVVEKNEKKIEMALQDVMKNNNLAKALKSNDEKQVKEALKELKDQLKNLSKEKKEALMKALGEKSSDEKSLAKALDNLSKKAGSGDLGQLSNSLSNLSDSMSEEDLEDALSAVNNKVSNGRNQMANNKGNGSGQGNNGNGNGNGSGSGKGNGSGQGNGNGSGAGSGAGSGSGNNDSTSNRNESIGGSANKSPGQGNEEEYQKVFSSKRLGGESEQSNLKGQESGNNNFQEKLSNNLSVGDLGDMVPYNEVFSSYKESAMESLDSIDIPEDLKDMIKEYFSSLE